MHSAGAANVEWEAKQNFDVAIAKVAYVVLKVWAAIGIGLLAATSLIGGCEFWPAQSNKCPKDKRYPSTPNSC